MKLTNSTTSKTEVVRSPGRKALPQSIELNHSDMWALDREHGINESAMTLHYSRRQTPLFTIIPALLTLSLFMYMFYSYFPLRKFVRMPAGTGQIQIAAPEISEIEDPEYKGVQTAFENKRYREAIDKFEEWQGITNENHDWEWAKENETLLSLYLYCLELEQPEKLHIAEALAKELPDSPWVAYYSVWYEYTNNEETIDLEAARDRIGKAKNKITDEVWESGLLRMRTILLATEISFRLFERDGYPQESDHLDDCFDQLRELDDSLDKLKDKEKLSGIMKERRELELNICRELLRKGDGNLWDTTFVVNGEQRTVEDLKARKEELSKNR